MNNQQQYQQPMQPNYSQPQQPVYGQQQPITEKSQHSHGSNWNNGLCDCAPCELCLKVYFCACFQVGQTQARNKGERNPGFFEFNSDCLIWYGALCLGGWQWIPQMINRGEARRQFGIQGGGCGDCMTSCCCHCCALIQEEKESLLRVEGVDAKTGQQYQPPSGMNYNA